MIRYVIRPAAIRKSPTLLARELNADTRRYPGRGPFDWSLDFFTVYPRPELVGGMGGAVRRYSSLYRFFSANKATQRELLAGTGLPVPETYSSEVEANTAVSGRSWIVRPLRHSRGLGYRITDTPTDFTEGQEYIQRVYPKDREYRLIFVRGSHLITLRKKVPEGLSNDQPWNHSAGAFFQTINNWDNCKLASTDILARLGAVPIINHAHIVAIDVMWSSTLGYSICELNSCPGLTIDNNLRKVASYAAEHQGLQPPAV